MQTRQTVLVDSSTRGVTGFVDIHSHILPGIDDGAATIEEAVSMLRMAASSGTVDIVATPHANAHYAFDPSQVALKIAELQRSIGPLPRIHRGCEFQMNVDNIRDALDNPAKYAINHLRYLLVEFSDFLIPNNTGQIFDRFRQSGLTPIVAHPERNPILRSHLDRLLAWIENGARVQVTAASFLGSFGADVKAAAAELMNRNMVHFVASDAHDSKRRTPVLHDAYRYVAENWDPRLAKLLFCTAPEAVIEGGKILLIDPQPVAEKKWYRLGF